MSTFDWTVLGVLAAMVFIVPAVIIYEMKHSAGPADWDKGVGP